MFKREKIFLTAVTIGLMFVGSAFADWAPGDGHKMHFPQLPDPVGLDVDFESPHMLADDWLCTESGAVADIHFWVSHREGIIPLILGLHVEIFSNVPAPATGGFSMPGQSLWQGNLNLGGDADFDFATAPGGQGVQGWYDPVSGLYVREDHDSYFQINLTNMVDPFIQKRGEIYWLGISIDTSNADGWKTSVDHFEDDAVYRLDTGGWGELRYPDGDPRAGESIDLAFVITPEPATLSLLLLGGFALLRRHRAG